MCFKTNLIATVLLLTIFSLGDISSSQETESPSWNTADFPNLDLSTKPKVQWKYGSDNSWFDGVVAYDGVVIGLDRRGVLHALDGRSGEVLWKRDGFRFDYGFGLEFTRDPKFDVLLVGCDLGLFAIDRKTGELEWENRVELGVDGPTCDGEQVFAASSDGSLYAFDLKTGEIRWKHDFLADSPADPEGFDGSRARFEGRPARPGEASTDGINVYFTVFDQCRLIAVDAKTGKRAWSADSQGWTSTHPVVGKRQVFFGSQDTNFYAVSKTGGNVLWKFKTGSRATAAGAFREGNYFAGSCDGFIYSIDVDMGYVHWKFKTEPEDESPAIYSQCILGQNQLLASTIRGDFYCLDESTGKLLWQINPVPDSRLSGDPQIDKGMIFFSTSKKNSTTGESCIVALGFEDK